VGRGQGGMAGEGAGGGKGDRRGVAILDVLSDIPIPTTTFAIQPLPQQKAHDFSMRSTPFHCATCLIQRKHTLSGGSVGTPMGRCGDPPGSCQSL